MRVIPGIAFNSLFARIATILIAGILASQAISLWLQSGERSQAITQARGQSFAGQMAETIRILEATPPDQRMTTAQALRNNLKVEALRSMDVSPNAPRGQIGELLSARLGSPREIRSANGMGDGMGRGMGGMGRDGMHAPGDQSNVFRRSVDIRLLDGSWFRMTSIAQAAPPALPASLVLQLFATLFVVLAITILAVRQTSRPFRQLATAADALGRDLEVPPLVEQGSIEVRQAAQAFNRMQTRLRHLLSERSRALAAVSHDLRTPLTKLRLRAELVDDQALRGQICADLDAMALMLDTTLDYLRSLRDTEKPCRIDMNAMLQSICDDASVPGHTVTLEGGAGAPFSGRLTGLRRAIQNLVDNAVKYGGQAHIHVTDSPAMLCIHIDDNGPGIPPGELPRVTEPYYRPDSARTSGKGGVGLGLSIANDIAALHGGELQLDNRPEGGLRATLKLPRETG